MRRLERLPWWVWVPVLVVYLGALYAPGSRDPGPGFFPEGTDKVVHVLLFAVPAFLARMTVRAWWPVVLLVLHAPISEVIQWRFVPARSGDPLDLVADFLGIVLGLVVAGLVRSRSSGAPEET